MQPPGTRATRLPGLLGSLLATTRTPERHGRAARRSRARSPLHASSGERPGGDTGQPTVRAPVGGTPQLGSARSNTGATCSSAMLSQLRDARRTEEEEKVKLGFFLDNGALVLFLRTSDWHQRFRSSW